MILTSVVERLDKYNSSTDGYRYNMAAERIYQVRFRPTDPFSTDYMPRIIDGLIAFGMARRMFCGGTDRTEFAERLERKLREVEELLGEIVDMSLADIDLSDRWYEITTAYDCLAAKGERSLDCRQGHFHVGATKILHWTAPGLFIIVDQHTARAFHLQHGVDYRDTTQPGYTAGKYSECLGHAQQEIASYGADKLRDHEPRTPLARVFDKVAWAVGKLLE